MTLDDKTTVPEEATPEPAAEETPKRKGRGFAGMDRTKVREIARKGGAAAHARGTAHRFTADEARIAGRKGGSAPHRNRGGATPPTNGNDGAPPPAT